MKRTLILIRHGQVQDKYQGLCYGASNIELSEVGQRQSIEVAEQVGKYLIDTIYHSNLKRTSFMAKLLAAKSNAKITADIRLRERNFGTWELKKWDSIYAEDGNQINGLFENPESFAPPNGETAYAFRNRIMAWYKDIPEEGIFAVIAHGGTIAALLGTLKKLPVKQWLDLIPEYGKHVIYNNCTEI